MVTDRHLLITRFLAGEMELEEQPAFQAWRSADPANEQFFQEVKLLWRAAPLAKEYDEVTLSDPEAALQALKAKQTSRSAPPSAPRPAKSSRLRFLRYAAAAVVMLSLGLFWLFSAQGEMQSIATGENEQKEIQLPDGSTVHLNANSTLRYAAKFAKTLREVELQGEAIFDVLPNPQKPFFVKTEELSVKVLGTSFNVQTRPESNPLVHVLHGKVQVSHKLLAEQSVILTKGKSASFNRAQSTLDTLSNFTNNRLFWHTKELSFDAQSLWEVFDELSLAYSVKIEVDQPELLRQKFSGAFKGKSISAILESLKFIYQLDYHFTDSTTIKITK